MIQWVAVGAFLLLFGGKAYAEEPAKPWEWAHSPVCAQLKVKGSSKRPFTVYEAPSVDSQCCAELKVRTQGVTEQFGYFRLMDLETGRYFVVFDLKKERLVVPLYLERRKFNNDTCGSESVVIARDKKTHEISVQSFITVD